MRRAHGACEIWDCAAAQPEIKARGGGDAGTSLTTSNAEIGLGRLRGPRSRNPHAAGPLARAQIPKGSGGEWASAALALLDNGTALPASRRFVSAHAALGTRHILILGQASG